MGQPGRAAIMQASPEVGQSCSFKRIMVTRGLSQIVWVCEVWSNEDENLIFAVLFKSKSTKVHKVNRWMKSRGIISFVFISTYSISCVYRLLWCPLVGIQIILSIHWLCCRVVVVVWGWSWSQDKGLQSTPMDTFGGSWRTWRQPRQVQGGENMAKSK